MGGVNLKTHAACMCLHVSCHGNIDVSDTDDMF